MASSRLQSKFCLWKGLNVGAIGYAAPGALLWSKEGEVWVTSHRSDLFKQCCAAKFSRTELYGQVIAVAVKLRKGKSEREHFVMWEVLIYAFVPLT